MQLIFRTVGSIKLQVNKTVIVTCYVLRDSQLILIRCTYLTYEEQMNAKDLLKLQVHSSLELIRWPPCGLPLPCFVRSLTAFPEFRILVLVRPKSEDGFGYCDPYGWNSQTE
jgi:hypothetical protein